MVWQLLTWPLDGLMWIAAQIEERASAEQGRESLEKQLAALQIRFDLGDIDEAEFTERERELLAAIEASQQQQDMDDT